MSGRFPGAKDVSRFWSNVCLGVESIQFFGDDELLAAGVDPERLSDPNYVRAGSILEGPDLFDAAFFGISSREAEVMDPQQRMFMECSWHALEHAGCDPEAFPGSISVYAGTFMSTYLINNLMSHPELGEMFSEQGVRQLNDKDYLATHVAYRLNLRGASVTVQSACSTSLVAVHLAAQALLNGECDMALAGGVAAWFPEARGYTYQAGSLASSDGHTRPFDARADGTLFGHGVGVVVLKRLSDAVTDGDTIYAVIRGSAINNDGSQKVGFTAPSVEGQAHVITEALAVANVNPRSVTYIEAHGTGTPLGDPIEVAALTRSFRAATDDIGFCALGSLKSNIGHLSVAAGVAGLIKTALMLHHRVIPPTLYFTSPNPQLSLDTSPFFVNTELRPWETDCLPRRAGVSSFGIGGTNAHVVLEEAPALPVRPRSDCWRILPISARTLEALEVASSALSSHFRSAPDLDLGDAEATLQRGRRAFAHRRTVVARDAETAAAALETLAPARVQTGQVPATPPSPIFMFPGGGAQYPNMGRDLYELEPAFRTEVDRCAEHLRCRGRPDLRGFLYPATGREEAAMRELRSTTVGLPALFATSYALAKLWESWGVRPQAMIGHSLGEYVAATLAGVISLEDALNLVALRGELFDTLPAGAMLGAVLTEDAARRRLTGGLSLAAVNGPEQCVFSGETAAINALEQAFAADGVVHSRLWIDVAGHSSMVDAILDRFRAHLETVEFGRPAIPFVSNLSGTWITDKEALDPGYWTRHLRETVHFADGLRTLLEVTDRVFVEVGPGQTLQGFLQAAERDRLSLTSLRHPQVLQNDAAFILNGLGRLWTLGLDIDWPAVNGEGARRVPLPTYPFERQRYWIESKRDEPSSPRAAPATERQLEEWYYLPSWKRLPNVVPEASVVQPNDRWVVFHRSGAYGRDVLARVPAPIDQICSVQPGTRFERLADRAFTVDPFSAVDAARLFDAVAGENDGRLFVLHAMDEPDACRSEDEHAAFISLLNTFTALKGVSYTEVRAIVVSWGACLVTGEEPLRPDAAGLIALARVAAQENAGLVCRCLDGDASTPVTRARLLRELSHAFAATWAEPLVAVRGLHRWGQHYEPQTIAANGRTSVRDGDAYLIADGLDEVGLSIAELIAAEARVNLILASDSALPELHNQAEDTASPLLRRLRALESATSSLIVRRVASDDAKGMQRVVAEARSAFSRLDGAVFVPRAIGEDALTDPTVTTAEDVTRHLRSKAHAFEAWAAAIGEDHDGFAVVVSSLSSVLGGLGHAAHASAFAQLDARVAALQRRRTGRTLLINNPPWAARRDGKSKLRTASVAVMPDRGAEAISRALRDEVGSHIVISPKPLDEELDRWVRRVPEPVHAAHALGTRHARPDMPTAFAAPRSETERRIAEHWQNVLGIEAIGAHDNFFELGGHSLLGAQVISWIRKTFRVELPLRAIFEGPTVAEVAAAVEANRSDAEEIDAIVPIARVVRAISTGAVPNDVLGTASGAVPAVSNQRRGVSLFFFSADAAHRAREGYELLLDASKFADERGWTAVWTPERHFNAFGGLYPNPSLTSAALAMVTQNVALRGGSVVLPLQDPLRVAEEWAVVDNLSGGRAGVAIASGWHPNDFVLAPENFQCRKTLIIETLDLLCDLWRGCSVARRNGAGHTIEVRTFPQPVQVPPPLWLSGESERSFTLAGDRGINVLTALLHQNLEDLARNVAAYRHARVAAGHDPETGIVTLMVHAYAETSEDGALSTARTAYVEYIRAHIGLHAQGAAGLGIDVDLASYTPEDVELIAVQAFERLHARGALIGTPAEMRRRAERLFNLGVNEIACLVDFGVPADAVRVSLELLNESFAPLLGTAR